MFRIFPTELSPEVLLRRALSELCVVVEEEYGWMRWLWFPSMSAAELHRFWLNLETVPLYAHHIGHGEWLTISSQCGDLVDEAPDYAMPKAMQRQEERLFDDVWSPATCCP